MEKIIEFSLELSHEELNMVLHALELYSLDMANAATVAGDESSLEAHESVESIISLIETRTGLNYD